MTDLNDSEVSSAALPAAETNEVCITDIVCLVLSSS